MIARFKGQDGSAGYSNGREYDLLVRVAASGNKTINVKPGMVQINPRFSVEGSQVWYDNWKKMEENWEILDGTERLYSKQEVCEMLYTLSTLPDDKQEEMINLMKR